MVPLLADSNSKTASSADFPIITKKLRNELIGDSKGYFQRSRIYMSTKVLLQHSLTMELGADAGKFLYKIVMLKFFNHACEPYTDASHETFNIELVLQMLAKMARRIEKLNKAAPNWTEIQLKTVSQTISALFDHTIQESKKVITSVRRHIDRRIEQIHQNQNDIDNVIEPLKCLNFEADVCHSILPELMKYLCERSTATNGAESFECEVKSYSRYFKDNWPESETALKVLKNEANNGVEGLEERLFWTDFENSVLYSSDVNGKSCDVLRYWALKYMKYSKCMYVNNQLLTSRMILVCLKIIQTMDERLCNETQLLQKHKTGINPEIFDALLLPQRIDMDIVNQLDEYFNRRNDIATDPSLIGEKVASNDSFSVKYAKRTNAMKTLRKQIQDRDEQNVQKKRLEWENGRQRADNLREHIKKLPPCDILMGTKYVKLCSPQICERCKKSDEITGININIYERLLPKEEFEQWAIVFEFAKEWHERARAIACLRDILNDFVNMFAGNVDKVSAKDWCQRSEFADFKNPLPATANAHQTRIIVRLGSNCNPFGGKSLHVEQPFDKFIATNTSNCIFYADQRQMPPPITSEAIKNSPLFAPFKADGEYSVLQWTLNGTTHTENEV